MARGMGAGLNVGAVDPVSGILQGVAAIGADVAPIASVFGVNKAQNVAQQQSNQQIDTSLADQTSVAQAQVAAQQTQAAQAAATQAGWQAVATKAIPWLGGALGLGLVAFILRGERRNPRPARAARVLHLPRRVTLVSGRVVTGRRVA